MYYGSLARGEADKVLTSGGARKGLLMVLCQTGISGRTLPSQIPFNDEQSRFLLLLKRSAIQQSGREARLICRGAIDNGIAALQA